MLIEMRVVVGGALLWEKRPYLVDLGEAVHAFCSCKRGVNVH